MCVVASDLSTYGIFSILTLVIQNSEIYNKRCDIIGIKR